MEKAIDIEQFKENFLHEARLTGLSPDELVEYIDNGLHSKPVPAVENVVRIVLFVRSAVVAGIPIDFFSTENLHQVLQPLQEEIGKAMKHFEQLAEGLLQTGKVEVSGEIKLSHQELLRMVQYAVHSSAARLNQELLKPFLQPWKQEYVEKIDITIERTHTPGEYLYGGPLCSDTI